jgi:hypothetical protein
MTTALSSFAFAAPQAETSSTYLTTVELLIHSVISGDFKWMTIDITYFYLGAPLPASRFEYLRIHVDKLPAAITTQYNLTPLIYNQHVYFEIRKCMYGLPQAGKLSQTRLIVPLSAPHSRNHVCLVGRRRFWSTLQNTS